MLFANIDVNAMLAWDEKDLLPLLVAAATMLQASLPSLCGNFIPQQTH